jgi:uncharacterized protein DUF5985
MNYPTGLAAFVSGLITMGYLVIGVFFMRFWRRTHDRLFMIFGIAFWLLALNYVMFALSGDAARETGWAYLIRLAAFCLIIFTIVLKNLWPLKAAAPNERRRGGGKADADTRSDANR